MKESISWLSVKQVSIYLGVSKETIYRLLKRKEIPSYRVGKLHKFNSDEINIWVKRKNKKKSK